MLQTQPLCLPRASRRSMTSSWVPSTACFVSKHNDPMFATLIFFLTFSLFRSFFPKGILSLVGNCLLLLVAFHKRSTLKPAEFFIINLSISDLGMTLSLFPLAIPSAFSHRSFLVDFNVKRRTQTIQIPTFNLKHKIKQKTGCK